MERIRAPMVTFSNRRQSEIMQTVRLHGACTIGELASQLQVSDETIRRNVKPLVSRGLILKVHGGIALPERLQEPPFQRRMAEHKIAKQRVAALAAKQIENGDSLVIDSGSTTSYVALALCSHSNLLVVTNSAEIARTLAPRNGNRVYMAGGELRANDGAAFGPAVEAFVRQFEVRHAVLSIGGISASTGFMDFQLCEAEFARAAIDQAEQTLVVADRSKFGRKAPIKVCDADAVDLLLTEAPPPPPFAERLCEAGVRLMAA